MKKNLIYRDEGSIDKNVVDLFERQTGYLFPQSYKKFISTHNAARLVYEYVGFLNTFIEKKDARDINFYGYGSQLMKYEQIEQAQNHDVYDPKGIVVVGYTANGDYICFDYRQNPKTDNPPIVVMYHDAFDDNRKMYVDFIAKDFDALMDSLYGYDDNDQKIYPEKV